MPFNQPLHKFHCKDPSSIQKASRVSRMAIADLAVPRSVSASMLYMFALVPVMFSFGLLTSPLLVYLWMNRPAVVIEYFTSLAMFLAGLRVKYTQCGKYRFCYAERGQRIAGKTSLVFLHGFSANKDMYLTILMKLPRDLHVILLDLPGHGGSDVPDHNEDLSLTGMASFVNQALGSIGVNDQSFHLIGTSLGGAIAAKYAAHYPKEVERVTLVCPAMLTPKESRFTKELREGKCMLTTDTVEGVKVQMDYCLYNKDKIPQNTQMLKGILDAKLPRLDFFKKLFEETIRTMDETQGQMMEDVGMIQAPAQVIWGVHDQLVDVSGVEVLESSLPNCSHVTVIDRCGHIITLDRPGSFTKAILEFRGELPDKYR